MTEHEWLISANPEDMMRWIDHRNAREAYKDSPIWDFVASDRKLRLFVVACCRQVWDQLVDDAPCPNKDCERGWIVHSYEDDLSRPCSVCSGTGHINRSRRAVDAAELVADSTYDSGDRDTIRAAYLAAEPHETPAAASLAHDSLLIVRAMLRSEQYGCVEASVRANLLREIFGNPWQLLVMITNGEQIYHPWVLPISQQLIMFFRSWLTWNDGTIPRIARRIYDEKAFQDMPVLADALEEAGCTDEAILRHCRGEEICSVCGGDGRGLCPDVVEPILVDGGCYKCKGACWQPRTLSCVRGCWVLDLILGKE